VKEAGKEAKKEERVFGKDEEEETMRRRGGRGFKADGDEEADTWMEEVGGRKKMRPETIAKGWGRRRGQFFVVPSVSQSVRPPADLDSRYKYILIYMDAAAFPHPFNMINHFNNVLL
jgi:hypothetical protein